MSNFFSRLILLFFIFNTALNAQNKKPNIILIFADDISAREFPVYNSDTWTPPKGIDEGVNSQDLKYRAKTPILNKLAKEGCFVKTAWASVICSPSRAMMMTGRYAHRHKWWGNRTAGRFTNEKGYMVAYPLYESSPNTIGTIAKKAGYATCWAGKTQMKTTNLDRFGFDEGVFTAGVTRLAGDNPYTNFRIGIRKEDGKKITYNVDTGKDFKSYAQSSWYWKPHVMLMNHPTSKEPYEWWPNTKESKKKYGLNTYGPDVELDLIFDFMDRKKKKNEPFFIYHTTHLGHDAVDFLHPKEKNKWPGTPVIKWENGDYKRLEPNITGKKGRYNTRNTVTPPGIHNHVNYLDYQVSLYLKKMKELKIEDNTVLIFCADNGTSGYGKGSPVSQKGTHVPFIVYAPGLGLTKKGEQDVLFNIADVLPTIAEIGGVDIPKNYEINGESFWSFLTTDKKDHREWIYAYSDEKQIIRSKNLMKGGKGKWYDVRKTPSNLISFPEVDNWGEADVTLKKDKKLLKEILPRFNLFYTERDGPLSKKHKLQLLKKRKTKK